MNNSDNISDNNHDKKMPSLSDKEDHEVESGRVEIETDEGPISLKARFFSLAWAGPLPTPRDLQDYAKISPDLVPRIITMAESEQAHKHQVENKMLDAEIEDRAQGRTAEKRGQFCALTIGVLALIALVIVAIFGNPWLALFPGGVLGIEGIAYLVSVFMKLKAEPSNNEKPSKPANNSGAKKNKSEN
jgi:uncharacterized membrane protein